MVSLDDALHVITTDDEKAKIIAMELANDNGRRIIDSLFIESQSATDLSTKLNIPMPTVMFHLERLMEIGLMEIVDTKLSRKFKDIKYYGPKKTAILIVPSQKEETVRSLAATLKASQITMPTAFLAMFFVAILGIGFSAPGLFQTFSDPSSVTMEAMFDNNDIRGMDTEILVEALDGPKQNPLMPLFYTLIGGTASLLLILFLLRIKGR